MKYLPLMALIAVLVLEPLATAVSPEDAARAALALSLSRPSQTPVPPQAPALDEADPFAALPAVDLRGCACPAGGACTCATCKPGGCECGTGCTCLTYAVGLKLARKGKKPLVVWSGQPAPAVPGAVSVRRDWEGDIGVYVYSPDTGGKLGLACHLQGRQRAGSVRPFLRTRERRQYRRASVPVMSFSGGMRCVGGV